ncbi:MAG: glycosyltransferase [Bacilli bacterium]|nr:glycosyltransferase [Bacilli bacterium]
MEQLDLISVIIPVYNVENYVRETLDSVLNQTYKNLEILVIDDGSTDNSAKICDEYLKDSRFKVFHRENVGNGLSRQFGIEIAKGKYFVSVDSDDYVSNDYIEKLYKTIKDKDGDISVCGINIFTDGKNDFHIGFMPPITCEKLTVTNDVLYDKFYEISQQCLLSDIWNKMYRTDFVKNTGIMIELNKTYNGSELLFNHSIALFCPTICFCNEAMLYHRVRNNSRVTKKDKPFQEGFEVIIETLLNICRTKNLNLNRQMSNIYYWLMGNVVMDIILRGGNARDKHLKFKTLVHKNKLFLKKHKKDLKKHRLFKRFKLGDSKIHLPLFCLTSSFWLDNACFIINFLRKIKIKFHKNR